MGKRRTPIISGGEPRTLHGETPAARLDLHGLDAATAQRRVDTFLETSGRVHPGRVVKVITGRGSHSEGIEVMRRLVLDAITHQFSQLVDDWGVETGGGAYLVRIRR